MWHDMDIKFSAKNASETCIANRWWKTKILAGWTVDTIIGTLLHDIQPFTAG